MQIAGLASENFGGISSEYQPRKVGFLFGLGLFFAPYIFAWWLLRSGYSNKLRVICFIWAAVALLIGISGQLPQTRDATKMPAPLASSEATTSEQPQKPRITATVFNELMIGLTYDAVAKIFGPGELLSSSNVGEIKTESYAWTNSDGSSMSLIFQNDRLVMKSQSGLAD